MKVSATRRKTGQASPKGWWTINYLDYLGSSAYQNVPEYVAWAVGIGVGIVLVRRGGGGIARLLLIGCACLFLARLSNPFLSALVRYNYGPDSVSSAQTYGTMMTLISGIPVSLLSLAGFICLLLAFRKAFRRKPKGAGA